MHMGNYVEFRQNTSMHSGEGLTHRQTHITKYRSRKFRDSPRPSVSKAQISPIIRNNLETVRDRIYT